MNVSLSNNLDGYFRRIMVVDDDADIRRMLEYKLVDSGFEPLLAAHGRQALDLIARQGLPSLAIVDINMPEMNGIQLCRAVHRFCDLPFIMLTAVDDEDTIVELIQECAEDYVTKPFSLNELMARVHRVLRRFPDNGYDRISAIEVNSRVAVDFGRHVLLAGDQVAQLTPTENKLLHIFMSNRRRTVSTEFLLSRLWPREEIFEDTLRVHVHRLRRKLDLLDPGASYIETERGLGYRFAVTEERAAAA